MRTDNLIRGFGEINDRLIEEAIQIEYKAALAKKQKGEKIMKITGITAACTAAAALLAVTLFPGLFQGCQWAVMAATRARTIASR